MTEWLVKYVPHDAVEAHKADGWKVEADLAHHGAHSVLMSLEAKERGVEIIKTEAA